MAAGCLPVLMAQTEDILPNLPFPHAINWPETVLFGGGLSCALKEKPEASTRGTHPNPHPHPHPHPNPHPHPHPHPNPNPHPHPHPNPHPHPHPSQALRKRKAGGPLSFSWIDATCHVGFAAHFELSEMDLPAVRVRLRVRVRVRVS